MIIKYYENNSINFFKNVNKGVLIDSSEEKVKILNFLVKLIYRNKKITVLKNFPLLKGFSITVSI